MGEKECPSCNGNQFKIVAGFTLGGWLTEPRREDHWFCPSCDWGKSNEETGEDDL